MAEKRRAPIEVLERLAEAAAEYTRQMRSDDVEDPDFGPVDRAYDAYRAATAPLRTLAEVDAEIAKTVRGCQRKSDGKLVDGGLLGVARDLCRLCSEPTANPGPTFYPTTVGCHWCGKVAPVTPVGWDNICAECLARGVKPSGSSSATAAKESRDNAGVSAGPAKEPDPCSCDEALELRRVIRHVHSLALEMARVTEGA